MNKNVVIIVGIIVVLGLFYWMHTLTTPSYSQEPNPETTQPAATTTEKQASPTPPPPVTICDVKDLALEVGAEGATGAQVAGNVDVKNISGRNCVIEGYPSLTLHLNNGKDTIAETETVSTSYEKPELVLMKPGQIATAQFFWSNWCGTKSDAPVAVTVVLPEGGTLESSYDSFYPGCVDEDNGEPVTDTTSILVAGPFRLLDI